MSSKWTEGWRWWIRYRVTSDPLGAIKDIYWWFAHRTFDRYDRVKLRFLKPGYYGVHDRMVHAMFTLLCEYIEKSRDARETDWDAMPDTQKAWGEMNELYAWWHNSYLKRREPVLDVPNDEVPPMVDLNKSQELYPVWHEACQQTIELEKKWHEEDIVNTRRLLEVRRYM